MSVPYSPVEDFASWFTRPGPVTFAHAKAPDESPIDRIIHITEDVDQLLEDDNTLIFVVADTFERELLLADMEKRCESLLKNKQDGLRIEHYGSLYDDLRSIYDRGGWKKEHVTVVLNFDLHFSAPFCLCLLHLMLLAKRPRGSATWRVIILSDSDEVDCSLWTCMLKLHMSQSKFSRIRLSPEKKKGSLVTQHSLDVNQDFVDFVIPHAVYSLQCNDSVIIMGTITECNKIWNKIDEILHDSQPREIFNVESSIESVKEIIRLRLDRIHMPPVLYLVVGTSQFPMIMPNLGAIFISPNRYSAVWNEGRCIYEDVSISRREIRQAFSYAQQSENPRVWIVHPSEVTERPLEPARKVENVHVWAFLFGLVVELEGHDVKLLAVGGCLVRYQTTFYSTLQQLDIMGVWKPHPTLCDVVFRDEKVVVTAMKLLNPLHFDFAAAWFLARALVDDSVTENTLQVMAYISIICGSELTTLGTSSIVSRRGICLILNRTAHMLQNGGVRDVGSEFSAIFDTYVRVPFHMWLRGGIWIQMASLHATLLEDPSLVEPRPELDRFPFSDSEEIIISRTDMMPILRSLQLIERVSDIYLTAACGCICRTATATT